jgi:hypothetical protein
MRLYADGAREHKFSANELAEIAAHVESEVNFQDRGTYRLSPAEIMTLLAEQVAGGAKTAVTLSFPVYGPSVPSPPMNESVEAPWWQFERSVQDLEGFIQRNHQIPNTVWLGSTPVPPVAFLVAMAKIASNTPKSDRPETVKISPAHLATEKYIAADSPEIWSWPIFPPAFHSEHLMELARLQAWTLKPAKRNELPDKK